MILSRAVLGTPIGDMLALDSGAGLCALEFIEPGKRLVGLEAPAEPVVSAARHRGSRHADHRQDQSLARRVLCGCERGHRRSSARHARCRLREARLGGAAADCARRDDELRRDGESAGVGRRVSRRRRGQRRQPAGDRRAVPSRHRGVGLAHRLRRRTRTKNMAARSRTPLGPDAGLKAEREAQAILPSALSPALPPAAGRSRTRGTAAGRTRS